MSAAFYTIAIVFALAAMGICMASGGRSRRMTGHGMAVVEDVHDAFLVLVLSVNGEEFRRDAIVGKKASKFEPGDGVEVRYDPEDIRSFIPASEFSGDNIAAGLLGFLGVVFVLAGYISQIV